MTDTVRPDTVRPNASIPRWSGLAGILGSLVLVGVFLLVAVFVGAEPAEPDGYLTRFPEVRTTHLVENTLYLATIALWVVHGLALYQALRTRRPAAALVGVGLTVLGLAMLAAGALPHLWQTPLADLYHAPGTTADEQAMLVMLWQATQGVFSALLVTGLPLVPAGHIAFGMSMRATPGLGAVGRLSIGLGIVGLAAAAVALVELSAIAALTVLTLVLFHLVVGWRTSRLTSQGRTWIVDPD